MSENSGTEASDDRITESKRTKYTDATKRANVVGLNRTAVVYSEMKTNTSNPREFMKGTEEESKKKAHDYYGIIAALEAEEAQLLRDLRAIRGQIEEEKRKLKRGE